MCNVFETKANIESENKEYQDDIKKTKINECQRADTIII